MKQIFIILVIFLTILVAGCNISINDNTAHRINAQNTTIASFDNLSSSQELKKFNNVDEMKTFLETVQTNAAQGIGNADSGVYKTLGASPRATTAMESSPAMSGAAATDYSQTNVQVQGVDEGDFVKNDGRYIYLLSGNNLIIIDGLNGKNSSIISSTPVASNESLMYGSGLKGLFLDGDKLIVFADDYEKSLYFNKYDITPIETYKENTLAIIYNIADRSNPVAEQSFKISGAYYDSRLINDTAYIITQEMLNDIRYYDGPMIAYAKNIVKPDIYYFDNPGQNYNMNTITSINLNEENVVDSKAFMLGYDTTLMVSENSIYLAYQKQQYWCWGFMCRQQDTDSKSRFMTVVVPLLQGDIKTKVDGIISQGLSDDDTWQQISTEFGAFYSELQNNTEMAKAYEGMFTNIQDKLAEYDAKVALENSKTIIQKININDGKIIYDGKGEIDGRLQNQYSMDEYNGNLRVATTINLWTNNGQINYNNVYVLDSSMNIMGSLTNLAENESIYSTRFMNDKLFMVTYRQIDPFFVIDLSNPTEPKVLGYLKIPGYSSYLYPMSDNLIIGVGKETDTNEYGGTITKGIKISLFDVSDFNNPKEISKYEIGEPGSDSPVLYDAKAFLYSKTKNMLVIPVTEIVSRIKTGDYSYRSNVWNGAYVFNVSDRGFELLGKVEHSSTQTDYYYWFNQASVERSLYIDDTLYTISTDYVKANDIANGLADLNTIKLPVNTDSTIPQPVPMPLIATATGGMVK